MRENGGGLGRDRAAIAPDARWLTYQEIADLLGMKVESARRRAQREDWPRQLGNDGRTRVAVPGDVVAEEAAASGATDAGGDHPGEVELLRELVGTLRDQLSKAEARAEQERREHHETRAALAVAREAWEARLDGLADDLAEERKARVLAELEAVQLRAELDRLRNRPWWRRLLGPG